MIPEGKSPQMWEVEWVDAASNNGTVYAGKYEPGVVVKDVGYLIYQGNDWIILAQEISSNSYTRRTIEIPTYAVWKMRRVK